MKHQHTSLGLCPFSNQLFYAINRPDAPHALARIGSFDFNIDTTEMLLDQNSRHFQGIKQSISRLQSDYNIRHLRIHTSPFRECWTTVPKIVYDNADEREDHIHTLMKNTDRSNVQPIWHNLSNQEYKFLLLRDRSNYKGFHALASDTATVDLVSDFKIGSRWIQHADPGGSFMMVGCFHNCISVTSFILGKMRGATYITFDDVRDLPYFWLQYTKEIPWMNGLHEEIYVYGLQAFKIIDTLESFWEESGIIIKMDTLEKIQVEADETTYGFSLEKAFPAIMLALNYDQ